MFALIYNDQYKRWTVNDRNEFGGTTDTSSTKGFAVRNGVLSVCLSAAMSVCLSVYSYVCVWLSNCLAPFVCLSACLSVCLPVCLFVCLSVFTFSSLSYDLGLLIRYHFNSYLFSIQPHFINFFAFFTSCVYKHNYLVGMLKKSYFTIYIHTYIQS